MGKACGRGIFKHKEGDRYDGFWMNDKANGFGKYEHNNGAIY